MREAAAGAAGSGDTLSLRNITRRFGAHTAVDEVSLEVAPGELLAHVGLEGRLTHKPAQRSGGEQQRVAVARALANRPLVLLADEPSGNLDPSTSDRLHEHLFRVCREEGAAMVLVTHDLALAARADRVLRLLGGQLVDAAPNAAGAAA